MVEICPIWIKPCFVRPQTKLREGNVFTPAYQPFCSQGGVTVGLEGCTPPGHTPPPDLDTPPAGHPLPTTVNKRAGHILLECFLVRTNLFPNFQNGFNTAKHAARENVNSVNMTLVSDLLAKY